MEKRIESDILKRFEVCGPKVLVTDTTVLKLYGNALAKRLDCPIIKIPSGEKAKSREVKAYIEDQLFELSFGSDVTLISLGGGSVSDVTGFVAATFCRGIKWVAIPTTLMAMCDAAIGGKNGVNIGKRKNAIGTIYKPKELIIDPAVLLTLSDEEYISGTAEMLKHGLIWDKKLWDFFQEHYLEWKNRNGLFLQKCIAWNISIKTAVIVEGKRDLLNFGHTVGHGIEMLCKMRHGEAVAIGMWAEALWSMGYNEEIKRGLERFGFDLNLPNVCLDELWDVIQMDKKCKDGKVFAVWLDEIGKTDELKELSKDELSAHFSYTA